MTTIIHARNVNDALAESMWKLKVQGVEENSRNGPVLVMPGPVITEYRRPMERVLFNAKRDANPYFHLMEALWMLGGRQDVAFLAQFVKRMVEYSDDGVTLHGAYGYRWRNLWANDQLVKVVDMLRNDPTSRRAVISMFYAPYDLFGGVMPNSRDIPCNTQIYLRIHHNNAKGVPELDLTVMCRSNDAVWGAHGANAVHFSVLHEFLAHDLGVAVGTMYQFSNNYHIYTNQYDPAVLCQEYAAVNYYTDGHVWPEPLIRNTTVSNWLRDLAVFLDCPDGGTMYADDFFSNVARPMYLSWQSHKDGDHNAAVILAHKIAAPDWSLACAEWLARRAK